MSEQDAYALSDPVALDRELAGLNDDLYKAPAKIRKLREAFFEAEMDHKRAAAVARLEIDGGTVAERDAEVFLATEETYKAMRAAESLYEHAKDVRKSLSERVSVTQTMSANQRLQYTIAGRGEY